MEISTKSIPTSLSNTSWMPGYIIQGTSQTYRCYKRNQIQHTYDDVIMREDSSYMLKLKCASLATDAIIRRIIAGKESF